LEIDAWFFATRCCNDQPVQVVVRLIADAHGLLALAISSRARWSRAKASGFL
jgi:hypothetical protein